MKRGCVTIPFLQIGVQKMKKRKEYFKKYNRSDSGKNRKRKYKQNKKKFNRYIYSLDIETSTVTGTDSEGMKKDCSFMYSCAISKLDTITHEIEHVAFLRTYKELSDFLYELESFGKKTLVYIHNFSYEWDFFNRNVPYYSDLIIKQLYVKSHKPLEIKSRYLFFRCSYLLTGLSVKKMGVKLTNKLNEDWQKLDYDYDEIRTPLTKLTSEEIAYNFRDVDIVLKYIDEYFLSKYTVKTIFKRIFTITSTARQFCVDVNSHFNYLKWIDFNNDCTATSEAQLFLWYECFLGGLVTSNPNYFMKITKDVASYDFASSYPYVMRFKKFPYKFKKIDITVKDFNEIVKSAAYNKSLYFNCVLDIKNLKIKPEYNYPILSEHKILKQSTHYSVINGKIIFCERLKTSLCSTDFELLSVFYDFDIVDILYYEENEECKRLPEYVLNSIDKLLIEKSKFKKYNNEVLEAKKYKKYNWDDADLCDEINSLKTYEEQVAYISDEYLRIKGLLNSQYGINVQKPLNDNISFNFDSFEYEKEVDSFEEYAAIKNHKTNLIVGCYICTFARYNLGRLLIAFLNNGIPVLYTDTDSIKCVRNENTAPVIDKIVDRYNQLVQNDKNIGQFEYEHGSTYDLFVTNGNKSYISLKDGYVSATISGMPDADSIYNRFYRKYHCDFYKMIEHCYNYNTLIDYSIVKKLTHVYSDMVDDYDELEKNIIHVEIDGYDDYVYTGIVLDGCNLSIRYIEDSTAQLTNACNLIKYFGVDFNKFIYKNIISDTKVLKLKIKTRKNKKIGKIGKLSIKKALYIPLIKTELVDEKMIKLLKQRGNVSV